MLQKLDFCVCLCYGKWARSQFFFSLTDDIRYVQKNIHPSSVFDTYFFRCFLSHFPTKWLLTLSSLSRSLRVSHLFICLFFCIEIRCFNYHSSYSSSNTHKTRLHHFDCYLDSYRTLIMIYERQKI